jgi:hypothetical protein
MDIRKKAASSAMMFAHIDSGRKDKHWSSLAPLEKKADKEHASARLYFEKESHTGYSTRF